MKHYMPQLGVYVYERYLEGKSVMVIINGANHEVDLPLARYKESPEGAQEEVDIKLPILNEAVPNPKFLTNCRLFIFIIS